MSERIRRRARAAAVGLIAVGSLGACGSHKADPSAVSACLDRVQARSNVAVVRKLYREGKLGDAATIRHELRQLRPTKPPFPVTSFLRADGTMPSWDQMNWKQQSTFDIWLTLPQVANVVAEPTLEASMRATEHARTTTCASG